MSDDRELRRGALRQNPYMVEDNWTVGRGWAIALRKVGLRTGIALIVQTAVFYFVWPMLGDLPGYGPMLLLAFSLAGAIGLPTGCIAARKLSQDTGLAGRTLMVLVLPALAAITLLAYLVAAALRGDGAVMIYATAAGTAIWSEAFAFRSLALQ